MNWTKGPIIGRGSTATVSLATTVAGDLFAVKSSELFTSSFLLKEQQFLSKLTSPHVIKYIGFDVDYDHHEYNLLMEYATGGTIADVIKKQGGFLDECLIRSYTRQILLGLEYLHSNNLVHCDIKCANMLVCEDGVKIGDLGCGKMVGYNEGDMTSSAFSGTPVFMAPEVARGEEQGFAADVWALGCVLIEMATGCNPWPEMENPVSVLYRIGYSGDVPLFPVWLSEEAKDFLNKCLQRNDKERWTVKELLQHPFVNLNSSSKKVENFPKNSPISVMDKGFWDCFQESELSPAPTRCLNVSGESPVDRIRQLVEATPYCLPNWVDEDDWITVRINHIDEASKISQQNLHSGVDDDDISADLILCLDSFVEDDSWSVRMMLGSDVDVSSGASVIVSRFLDFKNMNDDNCVLIDSNFNFALFDHLLLDITYLYNLVVHLQPISTP